MRKRNRGSIKGRDISFCALCQIPRPSLEYSMDEGCSKAAQYNQVQPLSTQIRARGQTQGCEELEPSNLARNSQVGQACRHRGSVFDPDGPLGSEKVGRRARVGPTKGQEAPLMNLIPGGRCLQGQTPTEYPIRILFRDVFSAVGEYLTILQPEDGQSRCPSTSITPQLQERRRYLQILCRPAGKQWWRHDGRSAVRVMATRQFPKARLRQAPGPLGAVTTDFY